MKLTIINDTKWQTRHLRAIAVRAIRGYYTHRFLTIYFGPATQHVGGCAYIGSSSCIVRIPGPERTNRVRLAKVIAHEAAHCEGVTHRQMKQSYRELTHAGNWEKRFAWADKMPLEQKPAKRKVPPPTGLVLAEKRHAQALKKAEEWKRKKARAAKLEKKWHSKVTYYERRMAAFRSTS